MIHMNVGKKVTLATLVVAAMLAACGDDPSDSPSTAGAGGTGGVSSSATGPSTTTGMGGDISSTGSGDGGCCGETLCLSNNDCAADEYCVAYGPACGFEEGFPTECVQRPEPTDCADDGAPVCGCDGAIYDNTCTAAVAGVDVDFEDSCAQGGGGSGGSDER